MPFKNIEEAKQKHPNLSKYSEKGQRAWLSAINSCFESGGDDGKCFPIAYSAANKADGKKESSMSQKAIANRLVKLAKALVADGNGYGAIADKAHQTILAEKPELKSDTTFVALWGKVDAYLRAKDVAVAVPEPVSDVRDTHNFDKTLKEYIAYGQELINKDFKEHFPHVQVPALSATVGSRFVRIVRSDGTQRSAWAFIDKANGDILKPAGWGVPARHARGNIFDKATWRYTDSYGPAYLR